MTNVIENINSSINDSDDKSEYLDSDYGITKDSVISCYAHYSGFAAILLQRVISCSNYQKDAKIDKRWTVVKQITGVASYKLIEQALKELKQISGSTHPVIVNGEVDLKVIKGIRFKASESVDMQSNADINASVFNLVCRVNDRQIVFKKDCSSLIESVKFYNSSTLDISLNALILACNSIPASSYIDFLAS
jgi:hypothetical protein